MDKPKIKSKRTVAEWEAELSAVRADRDLHWLALVDVMRGAVADNARTGERVKISVRASTSEGAGRVDALILRPLGAHGGILILSDEGGISVHLAEEWSRPADYAPLWLADLRQRVRAALRCAWDSERKAS